MKGKLLLALCLLLPLSCLPYAVFSQTRVKALTLPVHNLNTGLDYATIQDAVDASETIGGNTIRVDAGTYFEQARIWKSIALVGDGNNVTIIDGNGTGLPCGLGSDEAIIVLAANGISVMNLTRALDYSPAQTAV
jgi:pectin methylesterase-like acyl-CoA thioesterase